MNRVAILAAITAALSRFGVAQTENGGRGAIGDGLARRVTAALDALAPLAEDRLTIDDLADAVSRSLAAVEPKRLRALNEERGQLLGEEQELMKLLQDVSDGIVVPWMDGAEPGVPDQVTPDLLESEQAQLVSQQAEIFRLQREAEIRKAVEKTQALAARPTIMTRSLLGVLDTLPPAPQAEALEMAPKTEFPDRLARALFRTGDYTGALDNYKKVAPELLADRDRYEMARCLEETGDRAGAIELLDRMIAASPAETAADGTVADPSGDATEGRDGFWAARARSLKELLMKTTVIDEITEKGK